MDNQVIYWVITINLTSLAINLTLLSIISSDKIKHPIWIFSIIFITKAAFSICGVHTLSNNWWYTLVIIFLEILFLLYFLFHLLQRNAGGLRFSTDLIQSLHYVDLQIAYISFLFKDRFPRPEIDSIIFQCLSFILNEMYNILRRNHRIIKGDNHIRLSILLTKQRGKFSVLCSHNIRPDIISKIENKLRHGANYKGIAGLAATQKKEVFIPNLSDPDNSETEAWIPLESGEEKVGSFYCYPILEGLGNKRGKTKAVICIDTKRQNQFKNETIMTLLIHYVTKIETLLYCLENEM